MERMLRRSFESCKGTDSWHTGSDTFRGRGSFHCSRSGNGNKRDKIWKSCWWRWNQTGDVESADCRRYSQVNASVSSCVEVWHNSQRDWQTGVIIPIFRKGDSKQCTNHRGISILSLPGKVYAKYLERKCREIVELKLEDDQCSFLPGHSTTDQIFTLKQIFEKSWECDKNLFECFVDLEKAYDQVPWNKL